MTIRGPFRWWRRETGALCWQAWLRYLTITRTPHHTTVWFALAGRKPLAHLPAWKRRWLHLPSVRFRLWPRPWDQSHAYHTLRRPTEAPGGPSWR